MVVFLFHKMSAVVDAMMVEFGYIQNIVAAIKIRINHAVRHDFPAYYGQTRIGFLSCTILV